MSINFNASPYFDDFDEDKKFLKILYRPGVAVQTRELNQLQTQIQDQIKKFGTGIYKDGSMVIPGATSYNKKFNYVKLEGSIILSQTVNSVTSTQDQTDNVTAAMAQIIGKEAVGDTSGVKGVVKAYQAETDDSPLTIFVEYSDSGDDNQSKTFSDSENITIRISEDENNYEDYIFAVAETDATGLGTAAEISRGVYFVRGYFVLVEQQTVILNAYDTTPSYSVGLAITESIITPEEDSSLNDNANGTFNFAAPGAHRYRIDLTLVKRNLETEPDENYIELFQIENGEKKIHVEKTVYSEIGKEFARRTYDESGDYTVRPFRVTALEARNNDRGAWVSGASYLIGDIVTSNGNTYVATQSGNAGNTAPSHTSGDVTDGTITWTYTEKPNYNNGFSLTGSEDQLYLSIEPGKAYVRGYEIEKPSTNFVAIDKARDYEQINNDVVRTEVGNYVRVENVTGVPKVTSFVSVTLNSADGTQVGTARIRGIERFGADTFNLYIFDVTLNDSISFDRDVKIIENDDFSCSTSNMVTADAQGNVSISGTTVTGQGTRFLRDFIAGDIIDVDGNYYVIDSISTSAEQMTLASSATSATNVAYKIHRSVIQSPSRLISLYPMGRAYIKSVKNETPGVNEIDTRYTVVQSVTKTISTTTLTVSLSEVAELTGTGAEIFATASDIILCDDAVDTGGMTPIIDVSLLTHTIGETSITIQGLTAGNTYTVFFPVVKNTPETAAPKTKTLIRNHSVTFSDAAVYQQRVISLGKADIYRIRKIEMATGTVEVIDITDRYRLDDGQRDTHYDIGKIIRTPGFGAPNNSITVYFDYFTHSTDGDYFCVDSYNNMRREDIPVYSSIYGNIYLADVLDFRPRIADDGLTFTGSNSALCLLPKPGTRTEVDYTYYLPRIDKLSVDIEGNFLISKGTSNDVASAPEIPDMSMHLATITLAPYTNSPYAATIQKIDNRRYTMRDIGKIEKRVESLEYYTSLSLLEQQASSLNIIDDETGLNRFKNGFIVDNFAGHTTGDVASPDYKASIDMEMKELRPTFVMDNVNLLEKARTDSERSTQGYQLTGDIVTLPYTENEFIYQRYASRPENVNPFAIFTFIGSAELNPPSDEWIETQRIPEVINDVEGNFSSVYNAEKASGALGTVWNSWQTQWTGQVVTGTKMVRAEDWSTQDFGLGAGNWMARGTFTDSEANFINLGAGGRVLTYEIVATQAGQTRTGINTEVKATFEKEFINDRVVSKSVVPFIRARKIAFVARGLKLQTLVYPFFDQVNVSDYITPASRIVFTGNDLFDFETNAGQNNDEAARSFGGNVQSAYNKGDVIYVKTRSGTTYNSADQSPATAVCMLQEINADGTKSVLVIVTKGQFLTGDVIVGTISGAQGTVTSYTVKAQGDQLITNGSGDVAGIFDIPSTDALKFKTGVREFKLIDNLDNNDLTANTRAFGSYHAEGVLQTWQATYNSVRNAEVVRTVQTDERTIVTDERVGRLIRDTGWYDPLAQTFLVQNRGGAFITSVDVWFAEVDLVKPITMQIREVVNGYPGKNILPFSNVTLYPHELRDENQPTGYGLSTDRIEVEGGSWRAPNKPTKFKMKAPVYVQDVGEYCIVLLSNSNNYHVWTSELGGIDVTSTTPKLISEQPYAGVLFKSQNASTWTAHQNEDLMFRINIAEFQTQGSAEFVNARIDTVTLNNNPIYTKVNSNLIRVMHNNHGLYKDAKVTLSIPTGSYNGIASAFINGEHTVLHVEQDSYVIKVAGTFASSTGRTGGTQVVASRNVKFDVLQPIVQHQKFSDTTINFSAKTTSGKSIDGTQTPGTLSSYTPILANENNQFYTPRMISSVENEDNDKTFYLKADMTTSNTSLSPVIDTTRLSLITVSNRINSPRYDTMNYNDPGSSVDFDIYDLLTTAQQSTVSFSGNQILSTDTTTQSTFRTLRVGKYIEFVGSLNDGVITVITDIASDGSFIKVRDTLTDASAGTPVQIRVYDNYIDEIALDGSAAAKYLIKKVNLAGSAANSTGMNIRFAAQVPPQASIDVYYKIGVVGETTEFSELLWVKHATVSSNSKLTDQSFQISNLPEFNSLSVKLVMNSTNSAAVPRVKDLIVIASV